MYFVGLFLFSQFAGSIFFAAFINKLYQVEQIKDPSGDPSANNFHGSMRSSKIMVMNENLGPGLRDEGKAGGAKGPGRKNSSSLNKIFGMKNKSGQQRMQLAC
jgi:hypothetical protein